MNTLKIALAALVLGASAGTAFADSDGMADRDAFTRGLNAPVAATAEAAPVVIHEGRQAARIHAAAQQVTTPAATPVADALHPYPNSGLSEADQLRLKDATERDEANGATN